MSKYIVDENTMKGIANKTRTLGGVTRTLKPSEMIDLIEDASDPVADLEKYELLGCLADGHYPTLSMLKDEGKVEVNTKAFNYDLHYVRCLSSAPGANQNGFRSANIQPNTLSDRQNQLSLSGDYGGKAIWLHDIGDYTLAFNALYSSAYGYPETYPPVCVGNVVHLCSVIVNERLISKKNSASDLGCSIYIISTLLSSISAVHPYKIHVINHKDKVLPLSKKSVTLGVIYVPDSLLSQYRSATNWNLIKDRILPFSEFKWIRS